MNYAFRTQLNKNIITLATLFCIVALFCLGVAHVSAAEDTKRVAVVKNGAVENVISVPAAWPNISNAWQAPAGVQTVILKEEQGVSPGDSYRGGTFEKNKQKSQKILSPKDLIEYDFKINGVIAAQSFVNISTKESKDGIVYIDTQQKKEYLSTLQGINIALYTYKGGATTTPRLGLIAEESPIDILSEGGKGVDLYKLSTFTLASVQALNLKVQELEAQIASTTASDNASSVWSPISSTVGKVKVWVEDGWARIEKLWVDEIRTERFCVDDLCISREEFKNILDETGTNPLDSGGDSNETGLSDEEKEPAEDTTSTTSKEAVIGEEEDSDSSSEESEESADAEDPNLTTENEEDLITEPQEEPGDKEDAATTTGSEPNT